MNELNQEDNRWEQHQQYQVQPQLYWWYPEWEKLRQKVIIQFSHKNKGLKARNVLGKIDELYNSNENRWI